MPLLLLIAANVETLVPQFHPTIRGEPLYDKKLRKIQSWQRLGHNARLHCLDCLHFAITTKQLRERTNRALDDPVNTSVYPVTEEVHPL
jgi:hypothetical protein